MGIKATGAPANRTIAIYRPRGCGALRRFRQLAHCDHTGKRRAQKQVTHKPTSWIKAELVWLFVFIEWQSIQVATGQASGLGWQMLPAALVVIFGTIGYYIWRSYQLR